VTKVGQFMEQKQLNSVEEIAKKMLKDGMDVYKGVKYTNLPLLEVKKDTRARRVKLFFENLQYKKMLRDELKVSYGMKHTQAKNAIRESTISEALDAFPDVLMHDSIEDTARIVYLQYFETVKSKRKGKRHES